MFLCLLNVSPDHITILCLFALSLNLASLQHVTICQILPGLKHLMSTVIHHIAG